jgi:hypothetical protein
MANIRSTLRYPAQNPLVVALQTENLSEILPLLEAEQSANPASNVLRAIVDNHREQPLIQIAAYNPNEGVLETLLKQDITLANERDNIDRTTLGVLHQAYEKGGCRSDPALQLMVRLRVKGAEFDSKIFQNHFDARYATFLNEALAITQKNDAESKNNSSHPASPRSNISKPNRDVEDKSKMPASKPSDGSHFPRRRSMQTIVDQYTNPKSDLLPRPVTPPRPDSSRSPKDFTKPGTPRSTFS